MKVVSSDHVVSNAQFEQMAARREPLYCTLQKESVDLWTLADYGIEKLFTEEMAGDILEQSQRRQENMEAYLVE